MLEFEVPPSMCLSELAWYKGQVDELVEVGSCTEDVAVVMRTLIAKYRSQAQKGVSGTGQPRFYECAA